MIRVSLRHQTAVNFCCQRLYEQVTKTTFAAVDHLGNTSMTTQTIHSNLNVGQTGLVASEMKQNHDEMRKRSEHVSGRSGKRAE